MWPINAIGIYTLNKRMNTSKSNEGKILISKRNILIKIIPSNPNLGKLKHVDFFES